MQILTNFKNVTSFKFVQCYCVCLNFLVSTVLFAESDELTFTINLYIFITKSESRLSLMDSGPTANSSRTS